MRALDAAGYDELVNLAAQIEDFGWPMHQRAAAELLAYRRLHLMLLRQHSLPTAIAREVASFPRPGDDAFWRARVETARAEYERVMEGAPDLLNGGMRDRP